MRITKTQLMQIIKEELSEAAVYPSGMTGPTSPVTTYEEALGALYDYAKKLRDEELETLITVVETAVAAEIEQESMNEAVKPIEDLIKIALKNAELPEDIKLRAFYHAKPSDKVFLVPAEDKYNGNAEMYRPTRAPGGRLVFPENTPLLISIEAGKVGMPIEDLVNALKGMGLASIGKDAYTGRAY